jgi:hypothetical protein
LSRARDPAAHNLETTDACFEIRRFMAWIHLFQANPNG